MIVKRWTVYMLRCRDGSLYTGATTDLPRRLAAHRAGTGAAYTRARRPVYLVFAERARDRSAALRREAAIKQLPRRAKVALVRAAR
ncbi:MAG: GIY-YIG nuclease family protein [Gemmatimonadetes bacterium]|nr:GIY-YIG nuclease family protein [Gemmatimonadota bacterium]